MIQKLKKLEINKQEILFFCSSLLCVGFAMLSIWSTMFSIPLKFAGSSLIFIGVSAVIKFTSFNSN